MRKMCRCCQSCWEDFYWNCFEERFCYDESIANYNPDDDEDYLSIKKNGGIIGRFQTATTDNNNLTVPQPICDQPLRVGNSMMLINNAKIHEEDYRRETQTNVPMVGPEILAVFANSQIFQDHQPTKLNRISTKSYLPGIHSPNSIATKEFPTTPKESEQDRLLRRLEANLNGDVFVDSTKSSLKQISFTNTTTDVPDASSPEKRITFTLTTDSSPGSSHLSISSKKFEVIAEEDADAETPKYVDIQQKQKVEEPYDHLFDSSEVILRPRLIDRHPHLLPQGGAMSPQRRILRNAKSVPHFQVRPAASETDIFAITGSSGQISMTPEVPSISYSNLPKNYEDTPTIEKYRVSQSLYSIQAANAARTTQDDYSMPRYFRRSAMMLTQSTEILPGSSMSSVSMSKEDVVRRPEKEKSKRLKMLRGNLPPLLIHSVSFRKNRDEGKQVD